MNKITNKVIQRLKEKDEDAFHIIFYEYKPKIFYLAYKVTRNYDDAEDCVQEIFLKILKNIHCFDDSKSAFTTWVINVAKRYLYDYVKLRNVHMEKLVLNPLIIYCKGVQNNYDKEVLLSEIEKVIGELSYQVLMLKKGYNYTFQQIAEELNIHPSKAKSLYYEAYKKARAYVLEKEKDYGNKDKK